MILIERCYHTPDATQVDRLEDIVREELPTAKYVDLEVW